MQNRPILAYVMASLCFGFISFVGSENLFWSAPMPGMWPGDWAMTILAYSICCAAALSAVLWAGVQGWQALFLAGAILGWLVEGVVVSTAYDAFPLQLIWTPLAWHALITGLCIGGLCRGAVHWAVWRQVAGLVALGVFAGYFALYWPLERGQMPGFGAVFPYLVGLGVLVPLGNVGLDRVARVVPPPGWVLAIAPGLMVLVWGLQTALAPNPVRVSVPLAIGLTVWTMRRLRDPAQVRLGLDLGAPAPLWRHALFLLAPMVAVAVAVPGWQATGGIESNYVVAVGTGLVALWLLARLLFRAARARPAV